MLSLDSCRNGISRREQAIREIRIPASEIRVERGALTAGSEHLSLSGDGLSRLCAAVGSPYWYLASIPPSLRSEILRWHLSQGALGSGLLSLLIRDGRFLGIANPRLTRLGGCEVLDAVLEAIGPESCQLALHNIEWLSEAFQLDVISTELHEEVLPGDIVQGGLRVRHSLIAEQATIIEVFVLRLVCSNGMSHGACISRRAARTRRLPIDHPGARELQLAQVRRLASDGWSGLREKLNAICALPEEQLNVPQILRSWTIRAHLSTRRLLPLLMQAWQLEGGRGNAFDALNAITRVASHDASISLGQRRALAALAGVLAFRSLHYCPRCFSLLRSPLPGGETTWDRASPVLGENDSLAPMTAEARQAGRVEDFPAHDTSASPVSQGEERLI